MDLSLFLYRNRYIDEVLYFSPTIIEIIKKYIELVHI